MFQKEKKKDISFVQTRKYVRKKIYYTHFNVELIQVN